MARQVLQVECIIDPANDCLVVQEKPTAATPTGQEVIMFIPLPALAPLLVEVYRLQLAQLESLRERLAAAADSNKIIVPAMKLIPRGLR